MDTGNQVKVWDLGVRIFHWSLVILYFIAYLTGEDESDLHIYAGYGVIALIVFRIVWGFIGSKYARFSDFLYGPGAVIRYAKSLLTSSPEHYLGHNPVGGWMIILLLLSLVGVSWSGLELYAADGHGPLAHQQGTLINTARADGEREGHDDDNKGDMAEQNEEFWEEIHEVFANLSLTLVFLHIAGVVIATVKHRESLVKAMITGYKDKK